MSRFNQGTKLAHVEKVEPVGGDAGRKEQGPSWNLGLHVQALRGRRESGVIGAEGRLRW